MRTLVDIDEKLLARAVTVGGATTKKETIRMALEELIKSRMRQRLKDAAGSGVLDISVKELKYERARRHRKHGRP